MTFSKTTIIISAMVVLAVGIAIAMVLIIFFPKKNLDLQGLATDKYLKQQNDVNNATSSNTFLQRQSFPVDDYSHMSADVMIARRRQCARRRGYKNFRKGKRK
jgi:hypothetical protein